VQPSWRRGGCVSPARSSAERRSLVELAHFHCWLCGRRWRARSKRRESPASKCAAYRENRYFEHHERFAVNLDFPNLDVDGRSGVILDELVDARGLPGCELLGGQPRQDKSFVDLVDADDDKAAGCICNCQNVLDEIAAGLLV